MYKSNAYVFRMVQMPNGKSDYESINTKIKGIFYPFTVVQEDLMYAFRLPP